MGSSSEFWFFLVIFLSWWSSERVLPLESWFLSDSSSCSWRVSHFNFWFLSVFFISFLSLSPPFLTTWRLCMLLEALSKLNWIILREGSWSVWSGSDIVKYQELKFNALNHSYVSVVPFCIHSHPEPAPVCSVALQEIPQFENSSPYTGVEGTSNGV